MLLKRNIASQSLREQHLMRRLQYTLQVGRVTLRERQLLSELIQSDSPRHRTVFSRNLQ